MEQVCINGSAQIAGFVTSLITASSLIANFVKPDSMLGKAIHFLALNIRVAKTVEIQPETKG